MKKKRHIYVLVMVFILALTAGCSSLTEDDMALDQQKHAAMPDNILHARADLKEVYGLAVNYPEVLEKVPCYCGCDKAGHENNLDCYIGEMEGGQVKQWDSHGAT